ncbi:MAG: 4'-phosphopantetheinyl transferase superfamily protein [Gammaproteobacteria bacterium]|nr:4'-phosphopantetheinyl transferase superfamily protein [Gammaproteobacteria bacterium]
MELPIDNKQFLALSREQVDVWLVYVDETYDENLVASYRRLLTAQELEQEARFYFPNDRHRFLVTRALVRDVLSRYEAISPQDWRFEQNAYGRPTIANDNVISKLISFNISHSDGLIILSITRDRALGVDTENLTRSAPMQIANSYFSPREIAALHRLPAALLSQRFFELWTLKESYIKARGMGLTIPLDQFSFNLDVDQQIRIEFETAFDDLSSRWWFWQWRPSANHIAALCLELEDGAAATVITRKVIPLLPSETLVSNMLRTSTRRY